MTTVLPDPQTEFFAQDPTILAEPEALQEQAVQDGPGRVAVAVGMGAAYLVYRQYMKRKLAEEVGKKGANITRTALLAFASALWNGFIPRWVSMTAPYLILGYQEGIRSARSGTVEIDVLEKIATEYALQLGKHINEISAESMVSGFQAQVNRKVPAYLAAKRVAEAYGVPKRGMNALVNVWTSEEKPILSDRVLPSAKADRAQAIIESQNALRARQVGDNEHWAARSQGKQLVWMYGQQKGTIPSSARRVWITANDERVCEICGPLDGVEAPVGEKFDTAAGELWTPPSHVNCRCDIVLDVSGTEDIGNEVTAFLEDQRVTKAAPGDRYDRDFRGRFARAENRNYRPFKEREADIDEMLAQVNEVLARPGSLKPEKEDRLVSGLEKPEKLEKPTMGLVKPKGLTPEGLNKGALVRDMMSREKLAYQGLTTPLHTGKLYAGNLIKPEDGTADDGSGWIYMPFPIIGIIPQDDRDNDGNVLVDKYTKFYEKPDSPGELTYPDNALYDAIDEHWEAFVDNQVLQFAEDTAEVDEFATAGEYVHRYKDPNGNWWEIDETAFYRMLTNYRYGLDDTMADKVVLKGVVNGRQTTREFKSSVLAKYCGVPDMFAKDQPILVEAQHAYPGSTEQVGEYWKNPGRWRIVNIREESGSYHHMPYTVYEVEPAGLYEDSADFTQVV